MVGIPATGTGTLILFTRLPLAGRTKTRLMPRLGAVGAAELHRRLVEHTLGTARRAALAGGVNLEIHHTGDRQEMARWLGDDLVYRPQADGDLGARMSAALAAAAAPAVLIGTDCPDLTADILGAAFAVLTEHDAVLGPAADGGYYLVGIRPPQPGIFDNVPWGTDQVLSVTRERIAAQGLSWAEVTTLTDIDRPEDLARVPAHLLPDTETM